jgi:hypothetical protein
MLYNPEYDLEEENLLLETCGFLSEDRLLFVSTLS